VVHVDQRIAGPTVLIAAAGCAVGGDLAERLVRTGAQVVVIERSGARAMALARRAPARIETLVLDPLRPDHCRRLGAAWGGTPIDLLFHLHPLRAPHRPGAAVAAIPALTRALLPGLAQGAGQVLIACAAPAPGAPPEPCAFDAALRALPAAMQREAGAGARVNLLRLGPGTPRAALGPAVLAVLAQDWPGPAGSVLELAEAAGAGD
jgi:NAD(P)-dependent dehydrogenase (short-subunit alcohol dehydrogenase family)